MFVMNGWRASRAIACINRHSLLVGPFLAFPLKYNGASIWTNGSGTNSVKPQVCFCKSLIRIRCLAQCVGWSTWPNMIVAVLRNPRQCAISITSSHCCVVILSGQSNLRTSSSNTSAVQFQKMSIKQFVDNSIAENKVTIFSKSYCPYCKRVKGLFSDNFPDVKFHVIELDEREDGDPIQKYLYEKTGQRTVPSVFVNQQHIGGNDDTTASWESGQLSELLAEWDSIWLCGYLKWQSVFDLCVSSTSRPRLWVSLS